MDPLDGVNKIVPLPDTTREAAHCYLAEARDGKGILFTGQLVMAML
jgi:hypothetical protein